MKPWIVCLMAGMAVLQKPAAQNCESYYYLQNNKTVEMTIYNKKGDQKGRQVYNISDVKNAGGATTATVKSEFFDKKGKSVTSAINNIKCVGGILMMDMKMFISPEQSQQMKAEAQAADVYLSYPANMKVGDALPDGNFDMDIKQDNGMKTAVSVKITDRKVEGQESVTTPAGTWNCFKISYKSNIKVAVMGIGFPVKGDVTEWFAPGFGTVKTQSKWGTTEITSVK
ncbi:MAG TPA: hypothetical protein VFS36_09505 [Chitinophagaceae bacterium]|nr:hypothetical protein [Chitinophagaceae bacterium]